jgi:hypothetical protein
MSREQDSIARTNDAVLTNHNVYRDGSVWACRYCRRTWQFPSPVPSDTDPCVPRRWGDEIEEW